MSSTEIELKLELPDASMAHVRRSAALRRLACGEALRRKLRSIYFDTDDLKLREAGISLRVRRVGKAFVQTVKAGTGVQSGLSMPIEVEDAVLGNAPELDAISDEALSRQLSELIGDQVLKPVVETVIWRSTRDLDVGGEGSIEIAFDRGIVCAAGQEHEFSEVELECKSGRAGALLGAAEQLFSDQSFNVSSLSKAQRGFALIDANGVANGAGSGAQKFAKPELTAQCTAIDALRVVGGAACQQILANWEELAGSDDPEVPHQLRIGLRRLRTALRVFRPLTDTSDMKRMAWAARDLGRVVSPLRDADVVWEDICEPAIRAGAEVGDPAGLRQALDEHRRQTRESAREELQRPAWSWLKLNCILFDFAVERAGHACSARICEAEVLSVARGAMKTSWRRAKRWGREIDALSVEERHEMRKALKSLRYTAEFFAPLLAEGQAQDFLKKLKKLQDVFGYLNDVTLTNRLSQMVGDGETSVAGLVEAGQAIHDWHQARADEAWQEAKDRWLALDTSERFWKT
jgi:inorganic triphosphatase YgiF